MLKSWPFAIAAAIITVSGALGLAFSSPNAVIVPYGIDWSFWPYYFGAFGLWTGGLMTGLWASRTIFQ